MNPYRFPSQFPPPRVKNNAIKPNQCLRVFSAVLVTRARNLCAAVMWNFWAGVIYSSAINKSLSFAAQTVTRSENQKQRYFSDPNDSLTPVHQITNLRSSCRSQDFESTEGKSSIDFRRGSNSEHDQSITLWCYATSTVLFWTCFHRGSVAFVRKIHFSPSDWISPIRSWFSLRTFNFCQAPPADGNVSIKVSGAHGIASSENRKWKYPKIHKLSRLIVANCRTKVIWGCSMVGLSTAPFESVETEITSTLQPSMVIISPSKKANWI